MLVATRDHNPRAGDPHFQHAAPRSRLSRFTSLVQLLGSVIGIPIALASGYSLYSSNFSPESSCKSLRANIVGMLNGKADASTLRALVQRDVIAFERECSQVDADAAVAFKSLLGAETPVGKAAPLASRAEPAKVELRPSVDMKTAPVVKTEPKVEAKAEPKVDVKTEPKKSTAPVAAKQDRLPLKEEKTAAEPKPEKAVEEAKAVETTRQAKADVDAKWLASVREVLQGSAARPQAMPAAPVAEPVSLSPAPPATAPMSPPPIAQPAQPVTPAPAVTSAPPEPAAAAPLPPPVSLAAPPAPAAPRTAQSNAPVPPADIPNVALKPDHPVPPGEIPNTGASSDSN